MAVQIFAGFTLLLVYLIIMLAIVHIKKDISIGNFSWGGACLLLTLYSFFVFSQYHPRQITVTTCVFLWCTRLAYYVWLRYKKGADSRYVAWLEYWKNPLVAFLFSFGWIVLLNGFFACCMACAPVIINSMPQPAYNFIDAIGLFVWIVGFIFESMSDYQMYIFKQKPENKGTILDSGLWHYSRHPNYFGEITMWWGIYLLALSVPYGWLTIITPVAISITLLFVTGIPWAEAKMSNIPGYKEYKQRTSMIIPWFTKTSTNLKSMAKR